MKLPCRFIRAMHRLVVIAMLVLASLPAIPAAGQTPSMLDPTVTQVAAGSSHTCALTTAGAVECWGLNGNGQLGNGSTINATTPTAVNGLTGIATIAAGGEHTCALTTQGFVKCWGRNGNGELGDFTTNDRTTPVASGGLVGVAAIAAGSYHTCVLTTGGAVDCWGLNSDGQLGDGTHTSKTTAVPVSGLSGGVVAIAAGSFHTCALTAAGTVYCWGYNVDGRLGDGTTTERTAPVAVSGLSNVAAIAAGNGHTCALTRTDTVKCWGSNASGQLGNGNTTNSLTPVAVSGLSNVAAIAAGSGHACALGTTGGLKCWGANGSGQLGNGGTANATVPAAVSGSASGIAAIAAGGSHTCALDATGGLKCWGYNAYGQIGDASVVNKAAPVPVSGLASGVTAIAGGVFHTCAVTTAGVPMCWGNNQSGQLGDGTSGGYRYTPVAVSGLTGVAAMAAGAGHTCALTTAGTVYCWGLNSRGQLGAATNTDSITPVAVSGLTSAVAAIAADWYYTCALTTAGGVYCWGDNYKGQLGDGTTNDKTTPVAVNGLGSGVASIATGVNHACAITASGAVKCWGDNQFGQLGDGTKTDSTTPVAVSGLASGVAAITAGDGHTCAVTTSGAVQCWGYNGEGELGIGTTSIGSTIPVAVSGLTSGVTAIAAGDNHTCAVTTAGAPYCWGRNDSYQLGSDPYDHYSPMEVYGLYNYNVVTVAAGALHTCILSTAGGVACWGNNGYGQVGTTPADRVFPQSLLAGRFIALEPLARVGLGSTVNAAGLFASAYALVDTWTPDTCSASGGLLTFNHIGLCGVRLSAPAYTNGTAPAAPQQLRLIQVEADLIFANGVDVWNGLNH
jgi:alpha-tubulin suppressor-like RCC1 family protein